MVYTRVWEREQGVYTRGGRGNSGVYTRVYYGGYPSLPCWVWYPPYHAGYTHHPTSPGTPCCTLSRHPRAARLPARTPLSALTHRVTELNISDEGVTVAQRNSLSHPCHCWAILSRPIQSPKETPLVGSVLRREPTSGHPIVVD